MKREKHNKKLNIKNTQRLLVGLCVLLFIVIIACGAICKVASILDREIALCTAICASGLDEEELVSLIGVWGNILVNNQPFDASYDGCLAQYASFSALAKIKEGGLKEIVEAYRHPQGKKASIVDALKVLDVLKQCNLLKENDKTFEENINEILNNRLDEERAPWLYTSDMDVILNNVQQVSRVVADLGESNYVRVVQSVVTIVNSDDFMSELSVKDLTVLVKCVIDVASVVDVEALFFLDKWLGDRFVKSYGKTVNDFIASLKDNVQPNLYSIIEYYPNVSACVVKLVNLVFENDEVSVDEFSSTCKCIFDTFVVDNSITREGISATILELLSYNPDALEQSQIEKIDNLLAKIGELFA